jgi:hypothetical protein
VVASLWALANVQANHIVFQITTFLVGRAIFVGCAVFWAHGFCHTRRRLSHFTKLAADLSWCSAIFVGFASTSFPGAQLCRHTGLHLAKEIAANVGSTTVVIGSARIEEAALAALFVFGFTSPATHEAGAAVPVIWTIFVGTARSRYTWLVVLVANILVANNDIAISVRQFVVFIVICWYFFTISSVIVCWILIP